MKQSWRPKSVSQTFDTKGIVQSARAISKVKNRSVYPDTTKLAQVPDVCISLNTFSKTTFGALKTEMCLRNA